MSIQEIGHYIFGINELGNKFRPSDWIERIASAFGSFDSSRRLRYSPSVMPAKYDGQNCLFVASSLATSNPGAYRYIMDFVASNQLKMMNPGKPFVPEPTFELRRVA